MDPEEDETLADVDKMFADMPDDQPIVPDEPAAEVKEEVRIEDIPDETPAEVPVKEEVKEPAKEEVKPEEPVVDPLARLAAEPAAAVPTTYPAGSREAVLTELGIDASKLPIAKQMSNDAFNMVVETVRQRQAVEQHQTELQTQLEEAQKTGANGLPTSYYDHPQAFTLNPEYSKAVNTYQELNQELDHYEKQLIKVKQGEKWEHIQKDNNGQYQAVPGGEPDAAAEAYLTRAVMSLDGARREQAGQAQQIQQQFEQARAGRTSAFGSLEDQLFPQYKGKETENPYIQGMSKLLNERAVGDNPMAGIVSKLYAHALEANDKLNTANQTIAQLQQNQVAPTQNPTDDDINTGGAPEQKDPDSISEVEKLFQMEAGRAQEEYA